MKNPHYRHAQSLLLGLDGAIRKPHRTRMRYGRRAGFIANGWEKPEGLCESAWQSMSPFVMALAHGGSNFYDGWMKNERSAMISCNDGFRPVSFLIEVID